MSGVSYIVPAFNAEITLKESIISIYDGNFSAGDEVIIIDDASTDGTFTLAQRLQQQYPAIVVLQHRHNKGSANASRNTGIDVARNELLFCLDADNLLVPGSIAKLKQHLFDKQSDTAAFGEIHYFCDQPSKITNIWKLRAEISFLSNINAMSESPCSSGNYLLTRSSWKRAGRCNESVGGAWDSWAFGCALLGTGAKMTTLPGTWYLHRVGYESTFIREVSLRNASLLLLQILLPYLHLLHEDDICYIMSPEYREIWGNYLTKHPLRCRGESEAISVHKPTILSPEPAVGELFRILQKKITRRLGIWCNY